jgi:outer membrane protein assembly factor BamB
VTNVFLSSSFVKSKKRNMNRKCFGPLITITLTATLSLLLSCNSVSQNESYKGPGDNLPSEWGNNKNIRWSYELTGRGWSSPVVYGDKVFITTAFNETKPPLPEEEKPEQEPQTPPPPSAAGSESRPQRPQGPPAEDTTYKSEVWKWEVICLNLKTGKELWKQVAFEGSPRIGSHKGNGYASETPVTDGKRVYAYFGMTGIFCYDMNGKLVWKNDFGSYKTLNSWGTGSSPVLYNNKVYLQIDNEVNSFLVAIDALTGVEKWRVSRGEKTTYSSPFLWKNKLRDEIVACGTSARSYDPETGKLIWEMKAGGKMSIPSPVGDNEHLYIANTGGPDAVGSLSSVKAGANGNITADTVTLTSNGVEWYRPEAGTGNPSPVLYKGFIYILASNGKNLSCIDAATGKTVYSQKLEKVSTCWATPWVYKDNLYITDERGVTQIVRTGEKYENIGQNRIKDKFWASAALGYDAYVFKGNNKVYCISAEKN